MFKLYTVFDDELCHDYEHWAEVWSCPNLYRSLIPIACSNDLLGSSDCMQNPIMSFQISELTMLVEQVLM